MHFYSNASIAVTSLWRLMDVLSLISLLKDGHLASNCPIVILAFCYPNIAASVYSRYPLFRVISYIQILHLLFLIGSMREDIAHSFCLHYMVYGFFPSHQKFYHFLWPSLQSHLHTSNQP